MAASSLIGNLAVNLRMETAAFEAGAKRARAQTTGLQKTLGTVGTGLKTLAAGMIAGLSVTAITSVASKALEYASSLGEVAQQLGVTTSELQRYRYIASQVGIEQAEMDKGLSFLSRTLGDLSMGAKAPAKALERLGFNAQQIAKIAKMSAGDAIPVLADAFAKLGSKTEQSALAADLFGAKLGGKFLSLLAGGSAGINALSESYRKLGLEITPEQIAKADEAADKFSALKQVLEAKLAGFVADNADTIIKVADGLSRLAENAGTAGSKFGTYLDGLGSKLAAFDKNANSFTARIDEIDRQLGIPPPKVFFAWLGQELVDAGARWDRFAAKVSGFADSFDAAFMRLANTAGVAAGRIYNAVKTWIVDRLNAIWDGVRAKIDSIGEKFRWLYDVVVGHSYIPDMVTAIGEHMRRLDAEMVTPARTAAEKTAEAFSKLQALLARLFPEAAAQNQFLDELATLDDALKRGTISADEYAAALSRLRREGLEETRGELEGVDQDPELAGVDKTEAWLDRWAKETMPSLSKSSMEHTAKVAEAFANMATDVIGSMRGMVSAFKHGDIFGGIMQMLQIVAQVASQLGAFKGKASPPTPPVMSFGGYRARGGPVMPGRSYIVGENGPEWFTPPSGGRIRAHNDNGGQIEIRPSPYFDVVVDGRIVKTGAPMVQGAVATGGAETQRSMRRRQVRQIP